MAERTAVERRVAGLREWAAPRARIFGSAVGVGLLAGLLLTVALAVVYSPVTSANLTFALGTLALGFGVLGWSGSVFAGRGIENMQEFLDTGYEWSENDSRRAMTRVTGFGLGVALAVPPVATAIDRTGVL